MLGQEETMRQHLKLINVLNLNRTMQGQEETMKVLPKLDNDVLINGHIIQQHAQHRHQQLLQRLQIQLLLY